MLTKKIHGANRGFFIGIALSFLSLPSPATSQDEATDTDQAAKSIVEMADQIRFPTEGFQVDVDIVSSQDSERQETRKYRILSKGNDSTVITVLEPAADRGQILLMKGHDLWVFMPDVSQPVRISLAQRLTGEVANGDLARANFSGDYNPRLIRTETNGSERFHVLELKAVNRSVTYPRVIYWVNQKNNWPAKAEFYSLSNRLLKKCRYEDFQTLAGKIRPTQLIMEDALRTGDQSVLKYHSMKLRNLPDKVFTKDYLKKLN